MGNVSPQPGLINSSVRQPFTDYTACPESIGLLLFILMKCLDFYEFIQHNSDSHGNCSFRF